MEKINHDSRMDLIEGLPHTEWVDRMSKTDSGPFLLLLSLFATGFITLTCAILLIVLVGHFSIIPFALIEITRKLIWRHLICTGQRQTY